MKIKCPYCDTMFDDTLNICPRCGAPSEGVRRSSGDQPKTIEELAAWYQSKGLPPYETTRFFIGIDYKKPRAFGIYKDPSTGNFVVYKNKDSGQRAIRYQGTDEAYAVNELFQRLKEEIIQQKRLQVKKQSGGSSGNNRRSNPSAPSSRSASTSTSNRRSSLLTNTNPRPSDGRSSLFDDGSHPVSGSSGRFLSGIFGYMFSSWKRFLLCAFLIYLFVYAIFYFIFPFIPGYYDRNGDIYYCYAEERDTDPSWYLYQPDDQDWTFVKEEDEPSDFGIYLTAQKYFLGDSLDASYNIPRFTDSILYQDMIHHFAVSSGYYSYEDTNYYHYGSSNDYGWYYYDDDLDDWTEVDSYDLPEDLKHEWIAEDFYYTPTWDSETQITDFADSDAYDSLSKSYSSNSSWDSDDDDDWDWDWGWDDDDDDDDDWDWDWDDDDWDSDWGSDWDSDW